MKETQIIMPPLEISNDHIWCKRCRFITYNYMGSYCSLFPTQKLPSVNNKYKRCFKCLSFGVTYN